MPSAPALASPAELTTRSRRSSGSPSTIGVNVGTLRSSVRRTAASTCHDKPAVPPSTIAAPARSDAAPPRRTSARPPTPSIGARGMRLSIELAWNAVVDRVDDAADRAAAVQQCRRAAQHLDTLDEQRLQRHGVVVAQARRVDRGVTVVEQADAVTVEAANDRAARLRPEAGGRHAATQGQCVAGQHAGRSRELGRAERVARDEHLRGASIRGLGKSGERPPGQDRHARGTGDHAGLRAWQGVRRGWASHLCRPVGRRFIGRSGAVGVASGARHPTAGGVSSMRRSVSAGCRTP